MGADPLWCNQCGCSLDLEETTISDELQDDLMRWAMKYGDWIDWNKDKLLPTGIELKEEHKKQGLELTEKVKNELKGNYIAKFSSSTTARSYASKNF